MPAASAAPSCFGTAKWDRRVLLKAKWVAPKEVQTIWCVGVTVCVFRHICSTTGGCVQVSKGSIPARHAESTSVLEMTLGFDTAFQTLKRSVVSGNSLLGPRLRPMLPDPCITGLAASPWVFYVLSAGSRWPGADRCGTRRCPTGLLNLNHPFGRRMHF